MDESRDLSIPREKLQDVLRDAQVWFVLFFFGGVIGLPNSEKVVCVYVCVSFAKVMSNAT